MVKMTEPAKGMMPNGEQGQAPVEDFPPMPMPEIS
jgi:hypothetical protein